jgi:hypothetical protein
MSRIVYFNNQEVRREAVAPTTEMVWDPRTGNGFIRYKVQDEVTVDGVYQGLDNPREFKVRIEDIIGRTFTVATGPDTSVQVSAQLVMGALKAAFEEFYVEWVNSQTPVEPEQPQE